MSSKQRLTNRAAAVAIMKRLRKAGHKALLAGGCVRDMLLGRRPKDHDVATDATPQRVMALFRRRREVGAQFGVVIVGLGDQWIEVATFRSDLAYADGRHPQQVVFSDARQDAIRRDFTVNGMFYDPIAKRVIDYVGGQADLRRKVIRAIGDPAHRFREDHLRMVRAVRFATQLGFHIDRATAEAIHHGAEHMRRISAERVRDELSLILASPRRADGVGLLDRTRLLPHLWSGDSWPPERLKLSRAVLERLPRRCSFELGLAALLTATHPRQADRTCRALTCSNPTRKAVVWLLENESTLQNEAQLELADLKQMMQHAYFDELLALVRARLLAEDRPLACYRSLRRRAAAIPPEAVEPVPFVNGNDLVAMGMTPGPAFSRLLHAVYRAQLNEQVRTRSQAVTLLRRLAERD
ncbi:MAG TPA: CCA tRNA nucleotidyltransferase [Phycisphaerae bacterium]|nr:CCA tRNA nucleotidyltransferase [Phycisphaerae bacterium]